MPPRPRSRRLRSPLAVLAGATLLGLLGACGGPATGGGGTLRPGGADGPGDHLRLEGTPYQVGWWQGHLLRERALALHEGWQRDAFAADGDLASPATQERRRQALLLVDPVLPLLPETVREELQGLSDATGLPVRTLLLTELLTDVLRFTEREPRLLGGALAAAAPERGLLLALHGPFAERLQRDLLWITRPAAAGRPPVTVLAWPGSLGGLLAGRRDGLVAGLHEEPRRPEEQVLRGVPMRIALRLALERAAGPAEVLALLPRTTGHRVVAWRLDEPAGLAQLRAHVGEEAAAWPGPVGAPGAPPAPPAPVGRLHGLRATSSGVAACRGAPAPASACGADVLPLP